MFTNNPVIEALTLTNIDDLDDACLADVLTSEVARLCGLPPDSSDIDTLFS